MRGDAGPPKRRGKPSPQGLRRSPGGGARRPVGTGEASIERRTPPASLAAQQAVGAFLRARREALKLTQDQVADLTSGQPWQVSRATLGAIERGRCFPSMEVLITLTRALHVNPMEAIERAELAAAVPVDVTNLDLFELDRRAMQHAWRGEYREALATYDAMLQRLILDPPADPVERGRLEADVELRRAGALRRCGALLAARESAERALGLKHSLEPQRARAYGIVALVHASLGNYHLALDAGRSAVEHARECDDKIVAQAWLNRGVVELAMGLAEEARSSFLEALERAERAGDDKHLSHIEGNIGLCHAQLGQHATARARLTRAAELARQRALNVLEARWLVELSRLSIEDGKLDEAEELATAALDIARPLEHWLTIFRAEWIRHLIAKRKTPARSDRARIALLKRLLARLFEHEGEREIQEFRSALRKESPAELGRES